MPALLIGPARLADRFGTHEPGEILEHPSNELLALAESGARDPETGQPYCEIVSEVPPALPAPPAPAEAAPASPETAP